MIFAYYYLNTLLWPLRYWFRSTSLETTEVQTCTYVRADMVELFIALEIITSQLQKCIYCHVFILRRTNIPTTMSPSDTECRHEEFGDKKLNKSTTPILCAKCPLSSSFLVLIWLVWYRNLLGLLGLKPFLLSTVGHFLEYPRKFCPNQKKLFFILIIL